MQEVSSKSFRMHIHISSKERMRVVVVAREWNKYKFSCFFSWKKKIYFFLIYIKKINCCMYVQVKSRNMHQSIYVVSFHYVHSHKKATSRLERWFFNEKKTQVFPNLEDEEKIQFCAFEIFFFFNFFRAHKIHTRKREGKLRKKFNLNLKEAVDG